MENMQRALFVFYCNENELCPAVMVLHLFFSVDGNYLLFSKKHEIRGVDLNNANYNVIPALTVPFVYNPLAIDYDLQEQKIYWTDNDGMNDGINRAFLNGTKFETIIDIGIYH